MTAAKQPRRITRRQALIGLAGAGAVAGAGGLAYGLTRAVTGGEGTATQPDLVSVLVDEVPATDPESDLWGRAKAQRIKLQGQKTLPPMKPEPAFDSIRARSLHDGTTIAFLLEWEDKEKDELTIKMDQFRDACAVFLGPPGAAWTMGNTEKPVNIVQWKADWQLDMEAGFQDLEVAFPNVAFDFYPPLVGAEHPLKLPDAYPAEARMWLPGWQVGNAFSQPEKQSPVEKLWASGPGTAEPLATQDAVGRGVWKNGEWKVVIAKALKAADEQEVPLAAGQSYSLAFALWSGGMGDRGARKSITALGQLLIEAG